MYIGKVKPIPADPGEGPGRPWEGRQSIAGFTQRRAAIYTHIYIYGKFRVASRPGLWAWGRKPEYPEKTHADGAEYM